MHFRPHAHALVLALSVLAIAPASHATETAAAPTASTEANGYGYRFDDDVLAAGGLAPTDPRLHVVKHAARNVLIRPRTEFIAEMLKSVENL